MSSNFKLYLDYLASFANSHTMAVQVERNVYPLFSDLKMLIENYEQQIMKFAKVQHQLVIFIERLDFNDNDFDNYRILFRKLNKLDEYLNELKAKQVPDSIAFQIQEFITETYENASLYNLDDLVEQVLSKINLTYEVQRANKPSGCFIVGLLFSGLFAVLIYAII